MPLGKGEVFQQIVWNFTVCVGYWGYKDKDALNLKEGIHFRGLPQSLALLGLGDAVLTMSPIHTAVAVLYIFRALSLEGSPNPLISLYLFIFTLVFIPKLACLLELL